MTALTTEAAADPRFSAVMITTFAAIAVLLAAIGLYGVVAFGVVRRTREIAIQLALGASPGAVRWQVVRGALSLAAGGLVAGLLSAVWLGRLMEGLLFEVTPTDPATFAAVAAILLVVTVIAAAVPAAARHGSIRCRPCGSRSASAGPDRRGHRPALPSWAQHQEQELDHQRDDQPLRVPVADPRLDCVGRSGQPVCDAIQHAAFDDCLCEHRSSSFR